MRRIIALLLTFVSLIVSGTHVEAQIKPEIQAHIKQRHWYGASFGNKTSHFKRSMTMRKLDLLAVKSIRDGSVRNSTNVPGRKIHQYRFQRPIGRGTDGKSAHILRVVTDQKGDLVTAFPIN